MNAAQCSALPLADPYPSRTAAAAILPRREPVCHGGIDAPGPCTRGELEALDRDGFLALRGVFMPSEMAAVLADLDRVARDLSADDERLIREPDDARALRSVFAFHDLGGALTRLAHDARLVHRAEQILASPVYVHQSRVNRKAGFDGREFAWHSDFETWHVEDGMPAMRAVSISVLLTDSLACNGATMLIPGSHRHFVACVGETPERHYEASLRRQEYGVPDRASIATLAGARGYHVFDGKPGDVLIFDCNTLHASGSNLSHLPRTAAFTVYNSVDNRCGRPSSGHAARPAYIRSPEHTAAVAAMTGTISGDSA